MELIGFGGTAGSGKTTVSKILVEAAQSDNPAHSEFSDPIIKISNSWLQAVAELGFEVEQKLADDILISKLGSLGVKLAANYPVDKIDLSRSYVETLKNKKFTVITPEVKDLNRPLLEWIGRTAISLASPSVWGDIIRNDIEQSIEAGSDLITIGGIRTIADNNLIHGMGGSAVRIIRPQQISEANPSEYQINDWVADYLIENDGSLMELREKVFETWRSIRQK